jgi:hypothetical protein
MSSASLNTSSASSALNPAVSDKAASYPKTGKGGKGKSKAPVDSKKVGNPGNFQGARLAFLESQLPIYLSKKNREEVIDFFKKMLELWAEKFLWWEGYGMDGIALPKRKAVASPGNGGEKGAAMEGHKQGPIVAADGACAETDAPGPRVAADGVREETDAPGPRVAADGAREETDAPGPMVAADSARAETDASSATTSDASSAAQGTASKDVLPAVPGTGEPWPATGGVNPAFKTKIITDINLVSAPSSCTK